MSRYKKMTEAERHGGNAASQYHFLFCYCPKGSYAVTANCTQCLCVFSICRSRDRVSWSRVISEEKWNFTARSRDTVVLSVKCNKCKRQCLTSFSQFIQSRFPLRAVRQKSQRDFSNRYWALMDMSKVWDAGASMSINVSGPFRFFFLTGPVTAAIIV